jgi:hypothetical protein
MDTLVEHARLNARGRRQIRAQTDKSLYLYLM